MFFKQGDFAGYLLLTLKTLNVAFKFLFDLIFWKIRKDHLHLYLLIGIFWEALASSKVFFLHINNSRLDPNFNKLISRVEDINMHVIWSTAIRTLFINANKFPKNVTSQRSVIIRIKDPVFIKDILANLSKRVPLIFEGVLPIFQILLQSWSCYFWISFKSWLHVCDVFVRDVLLL